MKKPSIHKGLLEDLEDLFSLAPPQQLRKSLNEIFWTYLCNTEQKDLKSELKEISTDFYCLLQFLEVAEMYERQK